MRIIPVVDLKGGVAVRGIAGRRSEYQPVRSVLAADARPGSMAAAFAAAGFAELYLADLDAIGGAAPAWEIYDELAATGLSLWIDAGCGDAAAANAIAARAFAGRAANIIVGLESLDEPARMQGLVHEVRAERLIFSLDLFDGRLWTQAPAWRDIEPTAAIDQMVQAGICRLIVLDVAQVGTGAGPGTLALCRQTRRRHRGLQLTAGGGVSSLEDLAQLQDAGCDAVLLASALHDGRIAAADLRDRGWM